MSITPDWIKKSASDFTGNASRPCGDDHVTKSRNRKLIRVTSLNDCWGHRCDDPSSHLWHRPPSQAHSQKYEIGGGNDESGGAAGWSWWDFGRGCLPPQWGRRLSRYAAFWVQSDAFSDITRPVPNSLHSQPAESSDIIKPASATQCKGCRAF